MYNQPQALFTNVSPVSWYGRLIQFPLTRIIIAISFLIPVTMLARFIGVEWIKELNEPLSSIVFFLRDIFFLILFIVAYRLYTKYVERREALELSFRKFHKELVFGIMISLAVVGFMVVLMVLLGYYQVVDFNETKALTDSLRRHMMVGLSEEIIFRLILFKLVEEFAGSWWALVVQGLFFGFAHIANPNASLWTTFGLIADSTLLLGGGYMLTRRLWLVMGMHWSWNFLQEGVFGMPCSGITKPGIIQPLIEGPEWITGGTFGIEASYISVALNFLIGLYIIKLVVDKGLIVLPGWKRKSVVEKTEEEKSDDSITEESSS